MANEEIREKFENLYTETFKEISKYVVCHVKSCEDVEDLLQMIYLNAFKSLKKQKEITKTYLIGIAKHKIKDYYRFRYKNKTENLGEENDITTYPDEKDFEQEITLKYDTEQVWNYLKKKNVLIFQIFYLYFVLSMTLKEIAEALELTESNVKHYLYRTLKELKVKEGLYD